MTMPKPFFQDKIEWNWIFRESDRRGGFWAKPTCSKWSHSKRDYKIQLQGEVPACTSVEKRFSHWNVSRRVLPIQKRCKGAAAHRRAEDVGLSPQQRPSRQILFSPWTREESCARQLPHGAERRLVVFNSQPIFCPSQQLIPVLKLSSNTSFSQWKYCEKLWCPPPTPLYSIWTANHVWLRVLPASQHQSGMFDWFCV